MPDSTTPSKRQRLEPIDPTAGAVSDDAFVQDRDAIEGSGDDEDDEDKPKDKKAGRRKIKIEFIQDKSRRHITFSKRKAGIMKKARPIPSPCAFVHMLTSLSYTGVRAFDTHGHTSPSPCGV